MCLFDFLYLYTCFCLGVIRGVKDYGMPLHKHPELRGNLYVEFEIEFPESIGSKEVEVSFVLILPHSMSSCVGGRSLGCGSSEEVECFFVFKSPSPHYVECTMIVRTSIIVHNFLNTQNPSPSSTT